MKYFTKQLDQQAWWAMQPADVVALVAGDATNGLTDRQVYDARAAYGINELMTYKQLTIHDLVIEGITEPMMMVLLSIAGLSVLFGKYGEALAMIAVVTVYVVVECMNKYRTDRVMARLHALAAPTTQVIRNGIEQEISAQDIVVGDLLIVMQGTRIPADARLLTSVGLLINEASLTGESSPVNKDAHATVTEWAPLADRPTALFAGTTVLSGQGTAVVITTGMQTAFGAIAQEVQKTKKEKTALQTVIMQLAKVLTVFALMVSFLIPLVGFIRGLGMQGMILTWLSLTFLMIPGQPPVIITMALALAAFSLARKKIIVKRLRGAEVLGQVTAIVSDKTGTITENKMTVELFIRADGSRTLSLPVDEQRLLLRALPAYSTDPTDKAVHAALHPKKENYEQPIALYGFSEKASTRCLVYQQADTFLHIYAGSPEELLARARLSNAIKNQLIEQMKEEAQQGKRVVAYAHGISGAHDTEPSDLTFLALVVLRDPVRQGVVDALACVHHAGIATYLVTGDHSNTAAYVAREVGITGSVFTGEQLAALCDDALEQLLKKTFIFARTNPQEKVRIVKMLQRQGQVVAVIGDGINDAPALRAADVSIAMGQIGTDVAKEIADLVLTDDSYLHLPDAVAIGRTALDNFYKGITYYLSAKTILLVVFLIPLLLGTPFPFAPMHIIWIELLMDMASSTIFVTEVAESDVMGPRPAHLTAIFGSHFILTLLQNSLGLVVGISLLYLNCLHLYGVAVAQTASFVVWLIGHICLALNLKQTHVPLTQQWLFINRFAAGWLIGMIVFSVMITMVPCFHAYFSTTSLPWQVWLKGMAVIIVGTFWLEIKKYVRA